MHDRDRDRARPPAASGDEGRERGGDAARDEADETPLDAAREAARDRMMDDAVSEWGGQIPGAGTNIRPGTRGTSGGQTPPEGRDAMMNLDEPPEEEF
ncbi:MAG TPA: hypothetical protein VFS05_14995 [Gemmatimonadaceae bacterium]|nr:hypothetical protein [Gemmatimonadaceae bacterium]